MNLSGSQEFVMRTKIECIFLWKKKVCINICIAANGEKNYCYATLPCILLYNKHTNINMCNINGII